MIVSFGLADHRTTIEYGPDGEIIIKEQGNQLRDDLVVESDSALWELVLQIRAQLAKIESGSRV